ncbi:hypothetical protein [Peptoniphilus raoultii]|uniref:hypothetical protein n=1 Tax=Peptoniphilus raoultii TaxID=1776387 RepID=UPI0008DA6AD6|nr:hypothetical protein [Peptoniphilus raoultii]
MNYEDNLNNLKKQLDRAKDLKYKADARLESLKSQKEELLKEIKSQGINPEDLGTQIEKLEGEIKDLFEKANNMLPKV